jgi:hypothetical protein
MKDTTTQNNGRSLRVKSGVKAGATFFRATVSHDLSNSITLPIAPLRLSVRTFQRQWY